MLHVSALVSDKDDKLGKIRPLYDHMKSVCKSLYQPHENIAVDERMVKSKGRSGLCQFMANKPVRFGYKIWCVCDSQSGYTMDFK